MLESMGDGSSSQHFDIIEGQDEAELFATLAQVKDQLSLLGLKAAIARDEVADDFAGLDQLKQRLDQLEQSHQPTIKNAIARREEAMAPGVMAQLRRPAAMPFRKDTKLQGFAQLITSSEGSIDTETSQLEEEYVRAASELKDSLEQRGKFLSEEEADLLAILQRAKAALQEQSDTAADTTTSKKAEEALQDLLMEASAQGASLAASRAEVAAAENEATRMVESAQVPSDR